MWFVYIFKCSDETYYVGCTNNLEERTKKHKKGYIKYTSTRLPLKLVVYTAFPIKYKAYEYEKYLKSGSGRAISKRHYF